MIKSSEALDLARTEYINGYEEKDTTIFPTLNLIAKEFSLSLSTLRKKAANEGWYKKRKQYQNIREEYEIPLPVSELWHKIFRLQCHHPERRDHLEVGQAYPIP